MPQSSSENTNTDDSIPLPIRWCRKVSTQVSGYIGFESASFGAVLAFPAALLNSATTIQGAGKVLPAGLGGPVGTLLSLIYFLIIISDKAKKIHPLRRLLLILILSSSSAYCSFFSIYEAMSGVELKTRASEPALKAHNKFTASSTSSIEGLNAQITKKLPPQYLEIVEIEKEMDTLREKIDQQKKSENFSRAEELNTSLQRDKDRKDSLKPLPGSIEHQNGEINYSLYKKLTDFSKKIKKLDLPSPSAYVDADIITYKEIIKLVKNSVDQDSYTTFSKDFSEPKRDDYSNTPMFLIPWEIAQSNGNDREKQFLLFAATISLILEIAPLLLSGITFRSNNYYFNASGSRIKQSQDPRSKISKADVLSADEEPLLSSRHSDDIRTPMSQISAFTCFLIDESYQMIREVGSTLSSFKRFKLTNNMRNRLYAQFNQAMQAADLNDPLDQYLFIVFFYESIDHNSKNISLLSFTTGKKISIHDFVGKNTVEREEILNLRYKVAAGLLIDLMSGKQTKWLKKLDPSKKTSESDSSKVSSKSDSSKIIPKSDSSKTSPKSDVIGNSEYTIWHFQTDCYQEFLDWLLMAHYPQSAKQIESISAFIKLMLHYQIRLGLI